MDYKNIRTDLALEGNELFQEQQLKEQKQENRMPPGVEVENAGSEDIKITRVKVVSEEGEKAIGKPMGNYITLEVPGLRYHQQELYENTCKELAKELTKIIKLEEHDTVLVIGLGNWNVTPDALGPKVVSSLMVTRHLLEYVPEEVDEGVRPVCAIAPGVLGITGMETGEIVKSIAEKIKPKLVIAIDALASRRMDRVSTTIQICDTGIAPGAGVGNKRMELNKDTLGIPVIGIGIPTVVDAATMANDTIDMVIDNLIKEAGQGTDFYNMLKGLDRQLKQELIEETLSPQIGNFFVTLKEVDDIIERMSKAIANGLNIALHTGITLQDVNRYVH